MKKLPVFLLSLGLLFVFSCGEKTSKKQHKSQPPKWIYGIYSKQNSICGVGVSLPHIRGKAYQRATAISRAIDEIARQMHTKVNVSVEHFMRGSSSSSSSGLASYSVQTTTGQTVRAKIEDIYIDEKTQELYVLMCTY